MPDRSRRIERLSPAQRELLERRLAEKRHAAAERQGIRPAGGAGPFPLSFAQERFWFLDQLEPGSREYNMTGAGIMKGPLDVSVLHASLRALARRHAVLRTVFPTEGGVPLQVVREQVDLPLSIEDLTGCPAGEREAEVRARMQAFARRPFDLAEGPLLRALLLRLAADEHVFLFSQHHIVSDGWSLGVLVSELPALYNAGVRGAPEPLAPLPIQYADYAAWQRARLTPERLGELAGFWREALRGAPPTLELPTDRPRPPLLSHAGETRTYALSTELDADVRALSAKSGTTLFVTLLAAFQVFLHRITGEEDVVVGTSFANRDRAETRGLIGAFVGTLALRTSCGGAPAFDAVLARAGKTARDAFAHAELPFEKLVSELAPVRDPSRSPLFNVFFDMAVPYAHAEWQGLDVRELTVETGNALFDLGVLFEDAGNGLSASVEYNTDLFDRATIERLWESFTVLLTAAAADPGTPIDRLPLLSTGERRRVLEDFNATALDYDRSVPVHRLFAEQARRTPAATALEEGTRRISYADLNARSNRLAHHLRDLGVGPDAHVGVCLPRSADAIVAVLAIWKAGGAYVPLDPEDPPERVQVQLADLVSPVVVGTSAACKRLAAPDARFVLLDADADELARRPEDDPARDPDPEHLAYVVFTSGSTGRPKGVMVTHAALANHIAWVRAAFDLSGADRFLLRTPFSFDASIWEIVHPLVCGAQLVVAPPGLQRDPAQLLALVGAARVTVLQTVPSMLTGWLEQEGFAACRSLRHLICAGEPLTPELVERFHERCDAVGITATLHNLYGPSEACIDATLHTCERGAPPLGRDSVPIGRPIHNARVHVLDRGLAPVPVGVLGEIFVGGDGLARGYLNRPELTAERFLADLLGTGRLYRTGDRGRYLADGSLEYVGRVDHQVKLSGYRIELGEIESVLASHAGVREAAAIVADGRLVAYFVPAGDASPGIPALRGFLAERLPRYMLPAVFVELDAMPLTSSEKIDRRALPAPEASRSVGAKDADYVPPSTATEEELAALMGELLGLDRVGATDDFFALGGHSLLATQLAARVRERFRVETPLLEFFEHPTVSALARSVDAAARGASAPIEPAPPGAKPALSFAQERLWILDRLEPGETHYGMPGAMRLRGLLDAGALERSWNALLARHAVLRTVFADEGGRAVPVVLPDVRLPLPVTDLTGRKDREEEIRTALAAESRHVFDLARGPLVRASLFALAPREHVIVFNQHHIVSDGWSLGILLRDLGALYRAEVTGEPPALAPLPLQYADFAAWQRTRLAGAALAEALDFWRRALAGAPPALDLPADRPRPSVQSHAGAVLDFRLSPELSDALRAFARGADTTLFVTLLAAFGALLRRVTGDEDVVVGTAVAGRTRVETEALIGCFVNALPLRLDLSGEPTFRELLARVRSSAHGAFAHQDLPFEKLVDALNPVRDVGRAPVFQVSFDLESFPVAEPDFPELELEELAHDPGTAKLDLSLAIDDRGAALTARAEYATALFDAVSIERLWSLYATLLERIVSAADRPLTTLPLLQDGARRWLTETCNATDEPYDAAGTAHRAFAECARRTPAAPALAAAGEQLTYAELDARCNRFARHLLARGAGPGTLVGLCLERSPELLVAMFAVWKTGAAWLALDPDEPRERRRWALTECGATLAVTRDAHAGELETPGVALVRVEADAGDIAAQDGSDPEREVRPDEPAYVVLTSGSTGAPKAVAVPHRALANHTQTMHALLGFSPDDCVVQRIPITFDAALIEIVSPLAAGARLVLASPEEGRDPSAYLELCAREGVTVLGGVASWVAALLADRERLTACTRLRLVFSGGEPMPPAMPARFHALCDASGTGARLYNLYGPAEACVDATAHECRANETGVVPIGRPLPNVRVHLVDPSGAPVPVGVLGEICVAGAGVALGYRNLPELTAEKFVSEEPCGGAPGSRMYRTGDLGRRLPNGELVFVRRLDREVKIRGRRVEPGEIEAALADHPGIRAAAVTAHHEGGETRLVAHVAGTDLEPEALRIFLARRLPAALVPGAFRVVSELPRTPNGKVDLEELRRAPVPHLERAHNPPRTALERELCELVGDVLGVDPVGVHDDFFALGGSSLSAITLAARVREKLAVRLLLRDLFGGPTVAELSAIIGADLRGASLEDLRDARRVDLAREAVLAADIRPQGRPPVRRSTTTAPRAVLLTGATGFLGAFLLRELLERTSAEIICLVRARDPDQARRRIEANLREYELLDAADAHRIRPLPGDLAAVRFDLGEQAFGELAAELDLVVHCGAAVDFFHGYRTLEAANVGGTREVLRLACAGGATPVHFVSTIGVLAAPSVLERERITEDAPLDDFAGVEGGYEQTKWVAEKLVQEAGRRGLPVAVHRPGRVAGSATNGVWNTSDFPSRVFLGCLAMGRAPALDALIDVTPVDYVARAIVQLALTRVASGATYHLVNPSPTSFQAMFDGARKRGFHVDSVPYAEWQGSLADLVRGAPDHPLFPLLPLIAPEHGVKPDPADLVPDVRLPALDCGKALAGLAGTGVACPEIDAGLISGWLDFFERRGLLPAVNATRSTPPR